MAGLHLAPSVSGPGSVCWDFWLSVNVETSSCWDCRSRPQPWSSGSCRHRWLVSSCSCRHRWLVRAALPGLLPLPITSEFKMLPPNFLYDKACHHFNLTYTTRTVELSDWTYSDLIKHVTNRDSAVLFTNHGIFCPLLVNTCSTTRMRTG